MGLTLEVCACRLAVSSAAGMRNVAASGASYKGSEGLRVPSRRLLSSSQAVVASRARRGQHSAANARGAVCSTMLLPLRRGSRGWRVGITDEEGMQPLVQPLLFQPLSHAHGFQEVLWPSPCGHLPVGLGGRSWPSPGWTPPCGPGCPDLYHYYSVPNTHSTTHSTA